MPDWVVALVTNAGPTAGILAFMWWQERQERKAVTDKLLATLDRQIDLGEAVREALKKKKGETDG